MARFDVYEYDNADISFIVDVQADLLSDLESRVVIPLIAQRSNDQDFFPRLNPVITINGENHILMTADIGTENCEMFGKKVTNIEDRYRQDIIDAIEFLFQGF